MFFGPRMEGATAGTRMFNGKLSNASAVGQHLMGARAGDVLEFPVIDGTAKYEVLDVRK